MARPGIAPNGRRRPGIPPIRGNTGRLPRKPTPPRAEESTADDSAEPFAGRLDVDIPRKGAQHSQPAEANPSVTHPAPAPLRAKRARPRPLALQHAGKDQLSDLAGPVER